MSSLRTIGWFCLLSSALGVAAYRVGADSRRCAEPVEVQRHDCGNISHSFAHGGDPFGNAYTSIYSQRLRCEIGVSIPVPDGQRLTLIEYSDGSHWVTWETTDRMYRVK